MSSTPAMPFSRSQVLCPIFGKPEDLKRNLQILPKVYWFDIQDMNSVIQIWKTSFVPIVPKPRVAELLKNKLDIYVDLKRSIGRNKTENFKLKPKAFKKSIYELFDISASKCTDFWRVFVQRKRKESANERARFLTCCCCSAYLSSCHRTASDAN